MLGDEIVKQSDSLVKRVGTWDKAQTGIVEEGLFCEFLVEARRIGIVERATGIFRLVGLGITRAQIIRSILSEDVATASHLLQIIDSTLIVTFHHLADAHLIIGLARNATGEVLLVDVIVFQCLVVVFLLEIGIGDDLGHLRLAFLVGLSDIFRSLVNHRLIVALQIVDLHNVRRHHFPIVLMRAQAAEIVECFVVFLFDILNMRVIITRLVLVFAFVHHQAMEERHGLVKLARLEIGIAHVELHLLGFVSGEGEGIGLLIDSQCLLIFLFLEQMVGIKEVGMTRPSAAWVVVHKLDDFGWSIGMAEIEGADGFVVLCIGATLRFGIGGLGTVLCKGRQRGAILLILEQQHSFVEKGLRVVVFNMLLG